MEINSGVALIADDDEFFRIALRTILKSQLSFREVIETASLDDAIEQLAERSDISLALFDLAMPGMQSPASLKAVREFDGNLRIAVVSGSSSRSDVLSALEVGVNGYMPKGLGAKDLTAALRLVLEGAIYVPPSMAARPSSDEITSVAEPKSETDQRPSVDALTPRQRDVLELIVQGKSNKEIARQLDLGEGTVKIHLAALFRNLGVRNRAAAAVAGARLLPGASSDDEPS